MSKRSPVSLSASAGAGEQRVGLGRGGEQAELVAAHAVGGAVGAERVGQVAAEPVQQRVAGRVAEGVVVGLEAVEVEEREQHGPLGRGVGGQPLEVGEQRAPVAEAGQGVGRGLDLARAERAQVLAEGQREAQHGGRDGGGGEPQRDLVQPVVVVVDEQAERDQRERGGHDEHAAAQPARVEPLGGAAGGDRDEHIGGGPARVEQRVLAVGADRHLVQVDRVGDRPRPRARARGSARSSRPRDR